MPRISNTLRTISSNGRYGTKSVPSPMTEGRMGMRIHDSGIEAGPDFENDRPAQVRCTFAGRVTISNCHDQQRFGNAFSNRGSLAYSFQPSGGLVPPMIWRVL